MAQTVAEILVDQMVEAGIRKVYGIVGDSANPIVDALRSHESDIEFVHVRNEEAGAFAAGADAQISGRPTAVLGSSGPGSLHLLNGLYDCQRNAAPVFAIATHIPQHRGRQRLLPGDQPRADLLRLHPLLRHDLVRRPDAAALRARPAGGDPGARCRHGDPARRRRRAEVERADAAASDPHRPPGLRPTEEALDRARRADREGARRSSIHGGEGTRRARDEVLELSEKLKAPISYAYRGKDVLEADNPAGVGMTGLLGWGGATEALGRLRPAVHARHRLPVPRVPADREDDHPGRRQAAASRTPGGGRPRSRRRRRRDAAGAAAAGSSGARTPRSSTRSSSTTTRWSKGIQTYVTHEGSGHGLRPEMVATALSDLADDDAVFTIDTGMCNVWGARYLEMKPGRRLLASFSHGSMANAMPQAIGAKVGSPDRQVIALCGDGGFSMLMGELLTAAGLDIPVKLMIFNNSTLGMVRAEMMVVGYEPWGTDVKNPDFGALATAAGHPRRARRERRRHPARDRARLRPSRARR